MNVLHLIIIGSLLHLIEGRNKQIYPQQLRVTVNGDFSYFSGIYSQRKQDYIGYPFYEKKANKTGSKD